MDTKEEIRSRIKRRRLLLGQSFIEKASGNIIKRIETIVGNYRSFLFYYPFKNEVSLIPLAVKLLSLKRIVMFPKVLDRDMVAISVSSMKELSPGFMSIAEPAYNPKLVRQSADVVFVPGIAFDGNGYRIGYGKGFYDRFLKKFNAKLKIGVAFDFQVVRNIPFDPFDIPVDIVVTERRTIRRRTWK